MRSPSLPFAQTRAVTGLMRPELTQAAALCLRTAPDGRTEVLLVRTLTTKRWILPKGWPEEGLTLAETAAREAWEEAGVRGELEPGPIGSFTYRKIRGNGMVLNCRAQVFVLRVSSIRDDFPESNLRERRWMRPDKAARLVQEPDLRALLEAL